MKIYVASSWRNAFQPGIVKLLEMAGHDVYDFRNPAPGTDGFNWNEVETRWQFWTPAEFRAALNHPIARGGYGLDLAAMQNAEGFLLVNPCGRSAHLELGWACGQGKRTAILIREGDEPELMYKLVDRICLTVEEAIEFFQD